jgi:hypothetical protein
MGDRRGAYRVLVGKPEGKRPFGKPRLSWRDDIRIYLKQVDWQIVNWIDLAQDMDRWPALVNTVMNIRVP